jgi:hypothetical protein
MHRGNTLDAQHSTLRLPELVDIHIEALNFLGRMSRNISEKSLWTFADRLENRVGRATLASILHPGETRSTLLLHIGVLVTRGTTKVYGRAKKTE